MTTIAPIITNLSSPSCIVSSIGDVGYSAINNSLGSWAYKLFSLYAFSSDIALFFEPVYLKHYNVDGDKQVRFLNMVVDPYQFQNATIQNIGEIGFVFDGRSNFMLRLPSLVSVNLQLNTEAISPNDYFAQPSTLSDLFDGFSDVLTDGFVPSNNQKIVLFIENTLNVPQWVSLLGGGSDAAKYNINASTEYLYDITALNFSSTSTYTLEFKKVGAASFQTISGLTYGSFSNFYADLNDQNLGVFTPIFPTGLPAQTIYTVNDFYEFGDLIVV